MAVFVVVDGFLTSLIVQLPPKNKPHYEPQRLQLLPRHYIMKLTNTLVISTIAMACTAATGISDECSQLWTQTMDPVCASNGRTYNNKCAVEFDRLKTNDTSLVVVSNGNCTQVSGNSLANTGGADNGTTAPAAKSDTYHTKSAFWAVGLTSAFVWTVATIE